MALLQNAGSWLGKMRPPVRRAMVLRRLIECMARVGSHTTPGGVSLVDGFLPVAGVAGEDDRPGLRQLDEE